MKKKRPPHLCELGDFAGVLSRNSTYREDAWDHLAGTFIYDKLPAILAAVKARDAYQGRPNGCYKNGRLIGGKTQAQRAISYTIRWFNKQFATDNFKRGAIPYQNQAHHILVCEVFYDKKWTDEHLNVLLQVDYDINNEENIIYLPQGDKGREYYCQYHQLPNHAKGHKSYSQRLLEACTPIYNLIDKIVQKDKDCEDTEDIREKLYKALKQIESGNFKLLVALGAKPMK